MKKRSAFLKRELLLFLLAAALLTVPVFADFGPKPQFTVRVENGPEELYYLDILEEGEPIPFERQMPGGGGNHDAFLLLLPACQNPNFSGEFFLRGGPDIPPAAPGGAGDPDRKSVV